MRKLLRRANSKPRIILQVKRKKIAQTEMLVVDNEDM